MPLTGILKVECAVLPPVSSSAAMPDDAHASATWSRPRAAARSASATNDLPEPPGAWMKKQPPRPERTAASISSNTARWPVTILSTLSSACLRHLAVS